MKVLFVGSENKWALESHLMKGLNSLGHECQVFPARDIFLRHYAKNAWNKLKFKLGLSSIYRRINQDLLELVLKENFDAILVFKGLEICPSTIKKAKENGMPVLNYNPDHPFEFSSPGMGNSNVVKSMPLYDAHITYSRNILAELEKRGNQAYLIPFGYEESDFKSPSEESEILRLCFIGTCDEKRKDFIEHLASEGIEIDVYGPGWNLEGFENDNCVQVHGPLYNKELNDVAIKYRLHINIFRQHNRKSHNMRTFELAGLGCLVLSPRTEELMDFFVENEEIFLFQEGKELKEIVRKVMTKPYSEVQEMRKKIYKKCVASGYGYQHRARELEHVLNEVRS